MDKVSTMPPAPKYPRGGRGMGGLPQSPSVNPFESSGYQGWGQPSGGFGPGGFSGSGGLMQPINRPTRTFSGNIPGDPNVQLGSNPPLLGAIANSPVFQSVIGNATPTSGYSSPLEPNNGYGYSGAGQPRSQPQPQGFTPNPNYTPSAPVPQAATPPNGNYSPRTRRQAPQTQIARALAGNYK